MAVEERGDAEHNPETTNAMGQTLHALALKYAASKAQMERLVEEVDYPTGHAFVVFHKTRDRDRCARLFTNSSRSLYNLLHPNQVQRATARLECAAPPRVPARARRVPGVRQLGDVG